MATQILAIPQTTDPLDFQTSTTTDWIDSFQIIVAGTAVGYPSAGNVGTGSITVAGVVPQAAIGAHTLSIVEARLGLVRFTVQDPSGALTGVGTVGGATSAGGITFALSGGGFIVGDSFTLAVLGAPIDNTGIDFDLMARPSPTSAVISLLATTRVTAAAPTQTIVTGGSGGQIALRVPCDPTMRLLPPGTYSHELIAVADGRRVLVRAGKLVHVKGVTTPLS